MEKGQWWLVGAILLSSLLAVVYVWRFVEVAYFRAPAAGQGESAHEAPLALLMPAWLLIDRQPSGSASIPRSRSAPRSKPRSNW